MKGGRKSRNHNVPTETIITEEVKGVPDVTEEVNSIIDEGCLNVTNVEWLTNSRTHFPLT